MKPIDEFLNEKGEPVEEEVITPYATIEVNF